MSQFKLICEDEAIPFGCASKICHEFETEELFAILMNITQFLRGCGYISGDTTITLGKDINFSDE
jgi:hypothetical protein